MTEFISLDHVIDQLSTPFNNVKTMRNNTIRYKAQHPNDVKIDTFGRITFRRQTAYKALCELFPTELADFKRSLCIENNIPVPELVEGSLKLALEYYDASANANCTFDLQHSRVWFLRCANGSIDVKNIAAAGLLLTFFDADGAELAKWPSEKNLTQCCINALCFYNAFIGQSLKNAKTETMLEKWAWKTYTACSLTICSLMRAEKVFFQQSKYFLYQIGQILSVNNYYTTNMLLALMEIEYYQHCNMYRFHHIQEAAAHYDRPDWLESANQKLEKNHEQVRRHLELAEQKAKLIEEEEQRERLLK